MDTRLSPQQWLELDTTTRLLVAQIFNLKRSEGSMVQGNRLVSDGHTYHDLSLITVPAMQAYLLDTLETDFFKLFKRVVDVVKTEGFDAESSTKQAKLRSISIGLIQELESIAKRSEDNGLLAELRPTISNLFSMPLQISTGKPLTRFCNFCDSKGVKHLKTCTKISHE